MNKREMATIVRLWGETEINGRMHSKEICNAAASALEREAESEEKTKPKVTLAEMVDAVQFAIDNHDKFCHCSADIKAPRLTAAADTLRRLREEGRKIVKEHSDIECNAFSFLRSLVVEPL